MEIELEKLADDWISAMAVLEKDRYKCDMSPNVIDDVMELVYSDPNTLWLFIIKLLTNERVEPYIKNVGAGILEDLIVECGSEYLQAIKSELSKGNTNLEKALEEVWVDQHVKPSVEAYVDLGCKYIAT